MNEQINLLQGDCLQTMKTLADNSVDAIVSDPPYGISFMAKKWDYDVPSVEVWQEAMRVLKPGGHALIACGTRTQHRMVVNIEDAGFEIRDVVSWIYGSGFPKSLNIHKKDERCPDGWGTALKPSSEFFTLCRKPLSEKTIAANVLKWGTGGINIDGCRVENNGELIACHRGQTKNKNTYGEYNDCYSGEGWQGRNQGRFPANLIHDGSQEVLELFPVTKSGALSAEQQINGGFKGSKNCYGTAVKGGEGEYESNQGSAARFFYCAKASKKDRDEGLEGFEEISRKQFASSGRTMVDGEWVETNSAPLPRKNTHPTVKPTALMQYLCRLITPAGGTVLDPYMGSGSTGKAAIKEGFSFVGCELDVDYFAIASTRINNEIK